jgi:hypothetical protein
MATKTDIANMALLRLGEKKLDDISTDTSNPANLINAIWDVVLEESLFSGPEEGWRFARRRYHGIDRDSSTISSIAQNSTDITVTTSAAHNLIAGDMVELSGDTGYDGTYDINSVTSTTFDVTATFVATGTGTAKWTSERFFYRFAMPTSTRVTRVQVGGTDITDWVREGEYILTNQEDTEVDMSYVLAPENVTITNFPMHFVTVLWRNLASHLAYDLVQNLRLQNQLITEMEQIYIPRAIGMDNREIYVQEFSESWVDVGRKVSNVEGDFPVNPDSIPSIFSR